MPVVLIRDTQSHSQPRIRRMLKAANQAISRVLQIPKETVWVRYEPGKPGHYWEGETGEVPTQGRPVIVTIKLFQGRDPKARHQLFGELSSAIAGALNILPEYVWMQIEEIDPTLVGQGAQSYAELRKKK